MKDIKDIFNRIRKKGFSNSVNNIYRVIKFRLIPAYQKILIVESILKNKYPEPLLKGGTIIEVIRDYEKLKEFAERRGNWYHDYSKDLLNNGNYCFTVQVNGKIESCLWTSFKDIYFHSMQYSLPVPENAVPLIDAYTTEEFRGKGFYKDLWSYFVNYLIDLQKFDRIFVPIYSGNKRSLQVHKKLGADKIVIRVILIKGFGFKYHSLKKYS